jgi:hypothetical protein
MKDLCLCIASIGALEVPTAQWSDFVTVMANQATQNENMFFKQASVMIIGLTVESLPLDALSDEDLGNIWNAMLTTANTPQTD